MSDEEPKLIAIDEETDHEIVHGRRFGKTDGATHEPLDRVLPTSVREPVILNGRQLLLKATR